MSIRAGRTQGFSCATPACRMMRAGVMLTGVLAVIGAGWGGYLLGGGAARVAVGESVVPKLAGVIERERALLEREQQRTQNDLDAMAQRLGRLQGEMLRLNALGERLVEMANLDAGEFDFGRAPPMGGPESRDALGADVHDLVRDLGSLTNLLEDRGRKLTLLEELIMNRQLEERTVPTGKPVRSGWISSYFGGRTDPETGKRAFHKGIDFVAKLGSDVVAVADGVVEYSGWRSGYGRIVEIRHVGGYLTRYAHNSTLLVDKGDLVQQGQSIATLGSSGRTTGPHVHFEVLKDGNTVDPLEYVQLDATVDADNS